MTESDTAAGTRGSLVIADRAIERIASCAAGEVGSTLSVRPRGLSLLESGLPHASATVGGGHARLSVEVAAEWPRSAREVAAAVRDHVQARVTALTGVEVEAVDVHVADIVHGQPGRRRVR